MNQACPTKVTVETYLAAQAENLTTYQIAKRFDCSEPLVRRYAQRTGVWPVRASSIARCCPICGKLVQQSTGRKPRLYCSPRHQVAAKRLRYGVGCGVVRS